MKLTLNWLRQYVDTDIAPADLAARLTMLGLEVDAVEELFAGLDHLFVARVDTVSPHPNADKLVLCDVTVGENTTRVVCGAPNARPGLLTAIALPGAVMPSGMKVKAAKIRGENSSGMLCSEKDLGISESHGGIMELSESMVCGQPLIEALSLRDTMIEIDLTPNRPDCASVIGIAREVAGFVDKPLSLPVADDLPDLTGEGVPFTVAIEDSACPRYAARLITGVKIAPSPFWLRQRLLAVGLRPINNVVDVTNFVMMEYGQPLHAFDFRLLSGGKIIVRKARQGETFTTLDGSVRDLDDQMLMICDGEKPVAIAGIMGGENSEVSADTVDVLLESACFDPVSIRRTAGRLKMSTESSYRFERGVDPQGIPRALERAARLILELAGGNLVPNGFDLRPGVSEPPQLQLRVSRTNDLLGTRLNAKEIAAILGRIQIHAHPVDEEKLTVQPPSFRVDLEREVDLIEEIARLIGYNQIPTTLPMVPMSFPEADPVRSLRRQVVRTMTALGFHEAINYSFVSPQHFDMLGLAAEDQLRTTVTLLNPLAEDQSVMRTLLLPGLLENLRRNLNHQVSDVRLFEIGKVYHPQEGQELPNEEWRLAGVLCGRRRAGSSLLYDGNDAVDIYDVRGAVDQLLTSLRLEEMCAYNVGNAGISYAVPTASAVVVAGATPCGYFGQVGKEALKAFGIKQEVFFIDLSIDAMAGLSPTPKRFVEMPRFPSVQWDVAVVIPENIAVGDMLAAINECGEKLVERADVFDVFRGKNVDAGHKSVGLTITYRAADRTLDDETVGRVHDKITDMLLSRFNGKLREL